MNKWLDDKWNIIPDSFYQSNQIKAFSVSFKPSLYMHGLLQKGNSN